MSDTEKQIDNAGAPRKRTPIADVKAVNKDGAVEVHMAHEDYATPDATLQYHRLQGVTRTVYTKGYTEAQRVNVAIKQLHAMDSQDATEELLDEQIIKMHNLMDKLINIGMLDSNDWNIQQRCIQLANQCGRTVAALVDAKRRHRTGGTQVVKHVHVNEGGQAMVGHFDMRRGSQTEYGGTIKEAEE